MAFPDDGGRYLRRVSRDDILIPRLTEEGRRAALALVERVLPGLLLSLTNIDPDSGFDATVGPHHGDGASPALAILAALLSALIAKEATDASTASRPITAAARSRTRIDEILIENPAVVHIEAMSSIRSFLLIGEQRFWIEAVRGDLIIRKEA